ncbi:CinA family protein [Pseudomonas oryzihabitans]|uniref:Nicotinamide-nucleotide amidase n=1 Tax=Pseudomonas oryzihabitans TaxID=47885 RepID=A0AAJ2EXS8_9PSED|nr:CinA family protein [Pseudomonas psychrotolerans]MDR6235814.1 nicotinamide-nucleotide amidase [Pseudomonas psychrotolerans]MDR6354902.1 nicotinamide-nucleotide amidase [Pseudomonas psychrotolerans]
MDVIDSLAIRLGEALQAAGAQVTTAESCTGGGIAEAITRIAGSSAWFEAGFVTYSNRQKTLQLDVPAVLFDQVGAVSEEVVVAMARGAQRRANARFAVAVSGIAGPGGAVPGKPVGTVWLAWSDGEKLRTERQVFAGDRATVRHQTQVRALQGVLAFLDEEKAAQV